MKRIKYFNTYDLDEKSKILNESKEDIGRKVKIRDDSEYYRQAYRDEGDGYGKIIDYETDDPEFFYRIKWNNGEHNVYRRYDFDFVDDETEPDEHKIYWWKNGKLQETFDPLSGITSKVKITVDGGKSLVNRLIENLSLIVKKRSSKSIKVNSINGYVDKEVFIRHGIYYDTYLEIELINKDYIVGEFKSINGNITIRINDHLVYDMDSRHFDNEVLIDKVVSEYKKYLKDNKFIINEDVKYKTVLSVNLNEVDIEYLNKNFTNCWIKITPVLDDYLIWVIEFYKNTNNSLSFIYNKYKVGSLIQFCENPSYHVDLDSIEKKGKIIKYEEHISGQRFTDIDPYGEEDWDDTNEKKTYIDNGKEVEVINIYELLKEYSTFETSKLLRKITKGKLVRVQINRKSKWVDHWQGFDKYINVMDLYPLDFERIILRIEYNGVFSDMCINKRNRLLIKERKRIFTVEDPYGEEDWGDD